MSNEFVILAIHTPMKANILRSILEENGIEVRVEAVGNNTDSVYVEVKRIDLPRSLVIIEANKLFSYADKEIHKIDDGKKRILVAVDFSEYSMKACRIAFSIAKRSNAKVKILHVYHDMYFPSHIPFSDSLKETPGEEGMLDKARKKILDLCMNIDKKINAGEWESVNYSYSLREGNVEEEIDNFIREYKPSLLVLGTKGKNNNNSNLLGSVTADVIEITNVPVLAVPENSTINSVSDIRHIAFLTNLQNLDLSSFDSLVSVFGKRPDMKITFVHINDNHRKENLWTEDELWEISNNFRKQYPQVNITYKLINSPDIEVGLNEFIKTEEVNVISLTTRKRNIFSRIFMPSLSRKLLFMNNTAIFIFRK
ncbi:MAG TPA: universal stress protein [Dysgonomonas sp.]|nr:universal stress protein [Dysgonomonas sp.]